MILFFSVSQTLSFLRFLCHSVCFGRRRFASVLMLHGVDAGCGHVRFSAANRADFEAAQGGVKTLLPENKFTAQFDVRDEPALAIVTELAGANAKINGRFLQAHQQRRGTANQFSPLGAELIRNLFVGLRRHATKVAVYEPRGKGISGKKALATVVSCKIISKPHSERDRAGANAYLDGGGGG
jgi:hypothetical protein